MITCAITCSVTSQQLALDSGHNRLVEPRANEFEFELDVKSNESVGFQISDFNHAGHNYTVSVTAVRNGTAQTWVHTNGVCSSPTELVPVVLDVDVIASSPGVSPMAGGCVIRIQPKGKPD